MIYHYGGGCMMNTIHTKRCPRCGKDLPATEEFFYYRDARKVRLHSYCKECCSQRNKAHWTAHKERCRRTNKIWRDAHKESIAKRKKEWARANPDKITEHNFKRYGITIETYTSMCVAQDNRCAICHLSELKLHVDHDHKTGLVRGLLCTSCNKMLGLAYDNPDILTEGASYLSRSSQKQLSLPEPINNVG
jgi:hypothetical protein